MAFHNLLLRSKMKFGRLGNPKNETPVLHLGEKTYDLRSITDDIDGNFLASGGIDLALDAAARGALDVLVDADSLRIGSPIAAPGKIVCIGLNYKDHADETGAEIPSEPVVFMKDPSTVIGAFDMVLIPKNSKKTDWEVELGVVIGKEARYLDSPEDSGACIAGYVLSHDVSEREFQLERGGQWDKGKSCETFNPLGPYLVPASQIPDPQQLGLRLWVNDEIRQNGSTANQIFPVEYIVWYLSQFMVLRPGDLINTGTPAGVALGMENTPYLREGDKVTLEIDYLGRSEQIMGQA
jgi:2-keto-4-pentenoate hydratase/2-oxohepta-3-ene-1,7-dioic acid hydratase in catechol pathway